MSIRASNLKLFSLQAALFTPGQQDRFRAHEVLVSVLQKFATRFDGDVNSSSFDPSGGAPINIKPGEFTAIRLALPFVELASTDGRWRFKATPNRTDSYWFAKDEEEMVELGNVCKECLAPLFQFPLHSDGVQIGRMALIAKSWIPANNPAGELSRHFCHSYLVNDENANAPLRHSQTFKLENLKIYDSEVISKSVNSWVKWHSGEQFRQPAIIIENDINTKSQDSPSTAFTESDIQAYFEWAVWEIGQIRLKYLQG